MGIEFFSGVPDSLLADFSKELELNSKNVTHLISPNEGSAVASAIGYYAATNKIPLVYMQNSGLGNAINPLVSLASKKVWSIPMLLVIGWRGSQGSIDEPQHLQQGKITRDLLKLLEIPYTVFNDKNNINSIEKLIENVKKNKSPGALLFRSKYHSPYKNLKNFFNKDNNGISRIEAINTTLKYVKSDDILIATTGKTSRELYLLQKKSKKDHSDLFVVGGMGHASSIALGVLKKSKNKRVFLLDGDGALIMHMGIMSLLGKEKNNKFIHILLNNRVHDSVGGQPSSITNIDIEALSKAFKYKKYKKINTIKTLSKYFEKLDKKNISHFLNLNINIGSTTSLPRPKDPPIINFQLFKNKIGLKSK